MEKVTEVKDQYGLLGRASERIVGSLMTLEMR